jgi:uncharacterized protein (DUF427 family)
MDNSVSPSRTYVALCTNSNFKGYHFKKFSLPEGFINDSRNAAWYFLNRLDLFSHIQGCLSFENYSDIEEIGGGE